MVYESFDINNYRTFFNYNITILKYTYVSTADTNKHSSVLYLRELAQKRPLFSRISTV